MKNNKREEEEKIIDDDPTILLTIIIIIIKNALENTNGSSQFIGQRSICLQVHMIR